MARRAPATPTPAPARTVTPETIGQVTADTPRLIERAFPLRAASVASVHEKSVRHGHLSTLHIWPARRPLAASRAALIASLLPDPGTKAAREELLARIGGEVKRDAAGKERVEGGILAWGHETDPDLANFRDLIRAAYGGRAPRVMDPFAGGGAIPLEAMRLGCETIASDINPVAWFVERCTLEFPQRHSGQLRPLPPFVRDIPTLIEDLAKARSRRRGIPLGAARATLPMGMPTADEVQPSLQMGASNESPPIMGDLSEHVRAWGAWVHREASQATAHLYPRGEGATPLAYLWARTVTCKQCGGVIPLLMTRWIARTARQRVLLQIIEGPASADGRADLSSVRFRLDTGVQTPMGSLDQRRAHDARIGRGTMSKAGVTCPRAACGATMTMTEVKQEAKAGQLGAVMTAVVTEGAGDKAYRGVTETDRRAATIAASDVDKWFADIPLGVLYEATMAPSGPRRNSSRLQLYSIFSWRDTYINRQLMCLGSLIRQTRAMMSHAALADYAPDWMEAISSYLAAAVDKVADRGSSLATWTNDLQIVRNTFVRFALQMSWDFVESAPLADGSGGWLGAIDWIARYVEHGLEAASAGGNIRVVRASATTGTVAADGTVDLVVTDPPYYSAIAYADLMDYFYVWLRRTLYGISDAYDAGFTEELTPKWDHEANDGELVDDPSRFGNDGLRAKQAYEDGMTKAFAACRRALRPQGRMVVVFASKEADAWEALASAVIRAGFCVVASWPIETELGSRLTSLSGAGLASSVWLVCRPRPEDAPAGWEQPVIDEMRASMPHRLRELWDLGIRGPDLVWAATGPALEVYSRHPFVRRAGAAGARFGTGDFLREARRVVVDFAVGRLLRGEDGELAESLDPVTSYYLLHRNDFGMNPASAGACILYATSCGVTQTELEARFDLLARSGGRNAAVVASRDDDADVDTSDDSDDGGAAPGASDRVVLALKPWHRRTRPGLGESSADGTSPPMIDHLHKLMQLWKAGHQGACDDLIEAHGLRGGDRFAQLVQAVIELAGTGSDERALCESIAGYLGRPSTGGIGLRRAVAKPTHRDLQMTFDDALGGA